MDYVIKEMQKNDWDQVAEIYAQGIASGEATFESQVPSWEKWDAGHIKDCRFVARCGELIVGWVALSPVSSRPVYAGVAELSIYIREEHQRQGIGDALLRELVQASEAKGYWTLQGSVYPENKASLALLKKHGFREVGIREKIAKSPKGVWRNTVFIERRSKVTGV